MEEGNGRVEVKEETEGVWKDEAGGRLLKRNRGERLEMASLM